jgi:hypothetical protein
MGIRRLWRKLKAGALPSPADSRAFQRSCMRSVIRGFEAMSRPGIHFTAEQAQRIRSLADSGEVVGAQRLILDAVEDPTGGGGR